MHFSCTAVLGAFGPAHKAVRLDACGSWLNQTDPWPNHIDADLRQSFCLSVPQAQFFFFFFLPRSLRDGSPTVLCTPTLLHTSSPLFLYSTHSPLLQTSTPHPSIIHSILYVPTVLPFLMPRRPLYFFIPPHLHLPTPLSSHSFTPPFLIYPLFTPSFSSFHSFGPLLFHPFTSDPPIPRYSIPPLILVLLHITIHPQSSFSLCFPPRLLFSFTPPAVPPLFTLSFIRTSIRPISSSSTPHLQLYSSLRVYFLNPLFLHSSSLLLCRLSSSPPLLIAG